MMLFVILYFTAAVVVHSGYLDFAHRKPSSRQQGKYSGPEPWSSQL